MNINQKIANSIRKYPDMYRCRTDVLHHWFCVNGNGMEWHNGKLINGYDDASIPSLKFIIDEYTSSDREKLKELDGSNDHERLAIIRVRIAQTIADLTVTYNNADDLALVKWNHSPHARMLTACLPSTIYPLCEYARMNTVPDDVTPEYLSAVREMIIEVFESVNDGIHLGPDYDKEELTDNCKFANGVLQNLASRFGPGNFVTSYAEWQDRKRTSNLTVKNMIAEILKELKS